MLKFMIYFNSDYYLDHEFIVQIPIFTVSNSPQREKLIGPLSLMFALALNHTFHSSESPLLLSHWDWLLPRPCCIAIILGYLLSG